MALALALAAVMSLTSRSRANCLLSGVAAACRASAREVLAVTGTGGKSARDFFAGLPSAGPGAEEAHPESTTVTFDSAPARLRADSPADGDESKLETPSAEALGLKALAVWNPVDEAVVHEGGEGLELVGVGVGPADVGNHAVDDEGGRSRWRRTGRRRNRAQTAGVRGPRAQSADSFSSAFAPLSFELGDEAG